MAGVNDNSLFENKDFKENSINYLQTSLELISMTSERKGGDAALEAFCRGLSVASSAAQSE